MDNKYKEYLKSAKWNEKKEALFQQRGKKCQRCGSSSNIETHHKTYKNTFNEKLSELEVLCHICHDTLHKKAINIINKRANKKKNKDKGFNIPPKKIINGFDKGWTLKKIMKMFYISPDKALEYKKNYDKMKNKEI